MIIGVGVEGPADRAFWDKVLHKHFRTMKFDVRSMNGREKLIRQSPQLLDTFRDAHYTAGFILVDGDDLLCPSMVLQEFDKQIQVESRRPLDQRFLFICVAIRELEAWLLADQDAVCSVLSSANYKAPDDTSTLNADKILKELWRKQYGNSAFNKIDFARSIAQKFSPASASLHSPSFQYFWGRLGSDRFIGKTKRKKKL